VPDRAQREQSSRFGMHNGLGLAAAALFALGLSSAVGACPSRSARYLLVWAVAALGGWLCRGLKPRQRSALIFVLAAAGIALACAGIYQYLWGFAGQLRALDHLKAPESFLLAARERLLSRRVYATYPLPTTLAGTLAVLLPLQILALLQAVGWRRFLWGGGAALVAGVLLLTGSFGGPLALLVAGLWIWRPRRRTLAWALALTGVSISVLALHRGFWPWQLQVPTHPGVLRLSHWKNALSLFLLHPLGGIGPGNFEVAVTAVQERGAPASLYAHSAPLQLLAEAGLLGLPALAGLIWLAVQIGRSRRTAVERWVAVAAAAALIHNLIDIGFYFDSTAWVTAALLGLALPGPAPQQSRSRNLVGALALSAALAWVLLQFLSDRARFEARRALERGDPTAAQAQLESSPWADPRAPESAELAAVLAQAQKAAPLSQAQGWERAVRLDPWRASFHARRARALFEAGWAVSALAEAEAAVGLYPAQGLYGELRDQIAAALRGARQGDVGHAP
jgi:hypothetical protein